MVDPEVLKQQIDDLTTKVHQEEKDKTIFKVGGPRRIRA